MKADLHVHSWHSTQSGSLKFLRSRDCYSDPVEVYRTAMARGMDLVTITDHDSIDGCLELLDRCPDANNVIIGEEVSCWLPEGDVEVHLGVYGMTEQLHRTLQPLRRNAHDVISCLREHDVFFALNHLLHFYRGQVPLATYLRLVDLAPSLEGRNGAMLPEQNTLIEQYARSRAIGVIGGSDAHTLRRVARTWTEVPGARNAAEFVAGLRAGRSRPGGDHGSTVLLAAEIYGVVARYMASLIGLGPCSQPFIRRMACVAFSAGSLPFQFIPLTTAYRGKAAERATAAAVRHELRELLSAVPEPGRQLPVEVRG